MKRSRRYFSVLRWLALVLVFAAVLLTVFNLVRYSRMRSAFPPGMMIAGVPVGGMAQQQAAERIVQAYGIPIELRYADASIQIRPSELGFELELERMLAAADLQRINQPFWSAFWDFLWNRLPVPAGVPLSAKISEETMQTFLKNEIAPRYDQPPEPAMPIPGTVTFSGGKPGSILDIQRAVVLIKDALRSPSSRIVNLTYQVVAPSRPSLQNLQILLQQTIDQAGFDGLTEIYLLDLQTRQELSFVYERGENYPPGVAFTAASTVKIPIMISVHKRIPEPMPEGIQRLLALMVERSENGPADTMMQTVMDENLGPLQVTEDLQSLGMENTFLAGYFYPGAPLLRRYATPGNSRTDINTGPDAYNQTTPPEIGMLLDDIFQCAQTGGGSLMAVFEGEITQGECQNMIDLLAGNKIGVLLQAGLPEGTVFAHKHGWILENDGLIHHMSDIGIVYSPGGNYIVTAFFYHPVQVIFDPVNQLAANLSRAIYNYFNFESN
jgi:beta-lactamase class A